jgi:hypothetical protein
MTCDISAALDAINFEIEDLQEELSKLDNFATIAKRQSLEAQLERKINVLSCLRLLDDVYAAHIAISHLYDDKEAA